MKPRAIPWRVVENAPEIMACEATMAARVAMMSSGTRNHLGASRKNGFSAAAGFSSSSAPWPK